MRILVVTREIPPVGGGAGAVAFDLARALVRAGHEARVLTMAFGDLASQETIDGVEIERIECSRKNQDSADLGSMARFVRRGGRRARELASGFDLAHAHAIVPDGAAAVRSGLPTVITAHGTDVPGYDRHRFAFMHRLIRPWWLKVVDRAAALTTPSHHLAGLVNVAAPGVPVSVIPNGIDLSLLSARRSDRSGFLVVSRLIERKGFHRFLEALHTVSVPVRVDVVGDGPQRPRLESIADALEHDVVFHGWLEHGSDSWRELYESRRFFVFPTEGENFPINLLEAQLAGLTVLASDVPGCREVLGDAAIWLEPDLTPASIGATIRDVLQRPEDEIAAVGAAGAARVRARFGWKAISDAYLALFEEIV
jgi:glycosyltransferase involved in cell wall biosynthesis